MKTEKRRFKILDNPIRDSRASQYILVDDQDQVVHVGPSVYGVADYAFDCLGADEVRHDECLVRASDSREDYE